jgi:hypothetical protein
MTGGADRWIRWTTIVCVGLLALIAGTVITTTRMPHAGQSVAFNRPA